jgi:hypothetical protein
MEFEAPGFAPSSRFRRIGSEVMHAMAPRLWYLGENAGEKLEDVEGLPLGIAGKRVVVGRLAFIEESACFWCPVNARERKRASQQVACESLEAFGVLRPEGGRVVDGESAISK